MIMLKSGVLHQLVTRLKLRQLAGAKSFERGADYFAAGQVVSLAEQDGKLTATVQGTDKYQVTLFADGNALASECTCPMGVEGAFCRHCVAVGLAWLANGAEGPRTRKKSAATPVTLEDARAWLAQQDKSKLVEIILDRAATDPRLRDRLLAQAAKVKG
jgi:uncharacterized Zn finger protein